MSSAREWGEVKGAAALRDRIAAAIERHRNLKPDDLRDLFNQRCACGLVLTGMTLDALGSAWTDHLADAVIAELDLAHPCAATGCRMRQIARKHADASNELEADDE